MILITLNLISHNKKGFDLTENIERNVVMIIEQNTLSKEKKNVYFNLTDNFPCTNEFNL